MTFSSSVVGHVESVPAVAEHDHALQQSHHIEAYLSDNYIALSAATSVSQAQDVFYASLTDDEILPVLFVIDSERHVSGIVSVKTLLAAEPHQSLGTLMNVLIYSLTCDTARHEACIYLKQTGINYLPVLNQGKIRGVLGPRDIAQLKEDENTLDSQLQGASSPLETPYLENSIFTLWRKRSVWLLLLFVAEAYTGTVLKSFEDQLETVIALAFFIPLLIGTGGNTGTQITSTLVRAMALGEVGLKDLGAILRKEVSAAVLIALTIGIAGFIRAWTLGVGFEVMMVVSLTLVAITVWSAIVSSIIPMVLRRIHIDPALVSAPFISTLIDGTGLIIYFQIARVMLTI